MITMVLIDSLEMFARIMVTGFILDPETTIRDVLFSPTGLTPKVEHRANRAQSTIGRSVSKSASSANAGWRTKGRMASSDTITNKSPAIFSEVPFQIAIAKQKSLSTAGRPYLRHSWHRIDMIAVFAFWITFILAITGQEATATRHIYLFRALSVLRAGRLLVITSGTTTILRSLKRAGPLLITVAYFLIFAAGLFSIIGVQSFRGSFRRQCVLTDPNNSSNVIDLSQQCGGYLNTTSLTNIRYLEVDGSTTDVGAKGFICPLDQVCQTAATNPNGNSNSFDNIFAALVQVIIIASINTWSPIMYMAMDSDYFSSSLYFLVAVIVLNFWLINLLVAVVVNTFKDIRAETKRSAFGAHNTKLGTDAHWAAETKRRRISAILTLYEKTELFWVLLVLADLVAQACKTANSSSSTLSLLKNLELAFTFAFDLEIVIRTSGYFPDWKGFLGRGRNSFDLFLAVVCSIVQIPAINSAKVYPWLTVFQLLRWYRVILAFPRMKPLLVGLNMSSGLTK